MATLHRRYPNDRQRSLLASVELSLRRLPVELRQKLGPLGAFQGGGNLLAIAYVLGLDVQQGEHLTLGRQLAAVGLGTLLPVGHGTTYLRLNPALVPALWGKVSSIAACRAPCGNASMAMPLLTALQALLAGSRDPALADDPRLHFCDAAELRLLLDQLGPA